jgi:hypothetical protein
MTNSTCVYLDKNLAVFRFWHINLNNLELFAGFIADSGLAFCWNGHFEFLLKVLKGGGLSVLWSLKIAIYMPSGTAVER